MLPIRKDEKTMPGLHFDITGDNANLLRKLDEARNGVRTTSKQIEESGISIEAMLGRIAKGAAAFGAGFTAKELISNVVRVRGEFQQLGVAFNTMLGSEEKATVLMSQLVKTAATTPFDLQGVANGAKQLLAYGTAAEDINGTLIRLGDIAAGLSIPLGDLVYLYGTTMSQGRLYTQDLNQFSGRGIPMIGELAKQFGVAESEVRNLVESGRVGFPEVQKAIESMTNEGSKFGGLMEAQSKTITGQISNIEDSISTMYNNIGKQSEGFINDALSGASYLIENYETIGKTILELATVYGTYKAVLMSVAAYQSMAVGITYAAEITELSKLIPLKQQSANQDIIAAVNSGKLTQAKAEQVIALRAEVAAKIQSLQATEAQTKVEYSSAMASYKVATQRMLLAKQNMAIAQSQMSIAIKSGTVEEIAAAKKNAQTASLELNNAAIAKNTTHKSLNTAATNSKTASEALSTLETGKNSVVQTVNTASTNILTVAKTKLASVSRALGLSMLANPYVLATIAVVGLGYGIYKLITYQTDAEKAQAKLNDTVKEFNSQTASENAEIDRLFDKLRNANKETSSYQKTKDEIIKKYGSYLDGLNQEISTLNDVEAAYRAISAAARQAAADRAITKATQEAQDDWAESRGNVIDKLKNALTSGGKMTDGAAEAFIETINRELKETGRLSDETTQKIEKYNYTIAHPETGEVIGSGNSVSWAVDALKKNDKILDDLYSQINSKFGVNTNEYESLGKADINAYIKGFESALSNFKKTGKKQALQLNTGWVTFGSEEELELQLKKLNEVKDSFGKNNSTKTEQKAGTEWLASYKKVYEDADKAYNDFLKSKKAMSDTDRDNELKRLKELRDTAKTTYESKGGSTSSDNKQENQADKLRQDQDKFKLLMDKQARDQKRMELDSQHELEQIEINGLVEGSEKVLRQRKLNHKKELEAIDRETEDKKLKEIEAARSAHESNPENKKKVFNVEQFIKSEPAKKQFASFDKVAEEKTKTTETKYNRGDDLAWLLSEYQDYTDKRLAIEMKFNNDIATLEEQRKLALKNGDTQQVEEIDRAKAQATKNKGMELMNMDYDKLKESPEYVRAFENLKETSSETLNSLLSQLENAKGAAAKVLSPDQLREYTTTIQEIMDELDARNPFQSLSDKKQELADAEQELADAQMELENARQTVDAVKGGAKIENGVKSSKFNEKTGKIDYTKVYLSEAQALEKVKDKTNDYNKAKDNVVKADAKVKKAEKDVKTQIDELSNAMKDLGSDIGGQAGEIISLIGDIGSFTMFAMEGIKAAADTSAQAIITVEKASVILAIISAAVQIATKIAKLFKGEDEEEKRKKRLEFYNDIIAIYDKIIDKQKESIKFGYGFASIQAAKEAMENLNKQTEYYRKISSDNATSFFVNFKGRLDYKKALSDLGINADYGALFKTDELSELSSNQLEYIRDNHKELWASLNDEQRDALQAIIDAEEKSKDIVDGWKESITGISYDSFYTEFIDTLSDMDSSAEDMANSFGEYLKKSILAAMVANEFQKDIDNLYEMWVVAGDEKSDGGTDITADEAKEVEERQKKLTEAMIKRREEMAKIYGWESSSESQDSQKGFAAMSQDTGNELNGRFTALQISNEEIKNTMLLVLGNLSALSATSVDNNGILSDMRNLSVMSNSYLEDIARHTKVLLLFGEKLDKIESNTKGLSSR